MAMDVATFAKQLREDGIEAARIEAEKILAGAREKSGKIISDAENTAAIKLATASEEIARLRGGAEAELRFLARDLFLEFKHRIETVAVRLLREKIAGALSAEKVVQEAIIEVVKAQSSKGPWELALGPGIGRELSHAVINELFKEQNAKVKLVEGLRTAGFEMRLPEESLVIEVTETSVEEAFRRLMSPELARFIDSSGKPADASPPGRFAGYGAPGTPPSLDGRPGE